jgi:hypothetical protein
MKRNKYVAMLLVLILSFSLLHSFVAEERHQHIDTHECVVELEQPSHSDSQHAHVFHCEFHHLYILSDNMAIFGSERISSSPSFGPKLYAYYRINRLIKPPIS